ncbi:MAG: phosphoribosylformylglycinamidine synthase, partial [Desulfobacterales bacterium]
MVIKLGGGFGMKISTLEIALKPDLADAKAEALINKAASYFTIHLDTARCVHILTLESDLTKEQLDQIRGEIFTNPVTQVGSFQPLDIEFNWCIWIGLRPGVRDNAGATAIEAIQDLFGDGAASVKGAYTSLRYCITGKNLTFEDMETLASQLLSNPIIQQYRIFSAKEWNPKLGVDVKPPRVMLNHTPCCTEISIDSDEELARISQERNLALHPRDIPVIRSY